VGDLPNNFGVLGTYGPFCQTDHVTLAVTAIVADAGLRGPSVYTKFEVRRSSRSEDIGHLLREH